MKIEIEELLEYLQDVSEHYENTLYLFKKNHSNKIEIIKYLEGIYEAYDQIMNKLIDIRETKNESTSKF